MRNRRRYYRLRYPQHARPRPGVWIAGSWRTVAEISECGLRVIADEDVDVRAGDLVPVVVKLAEDDAAVRIDEATVLRRDRGELVVYFDHGLPPALVFREQRRLIRDARRRRSTDALAALRPQASAGY